MRFILIIFFTVFTGNSYCQLTDGKSMSSAVELPLELNSLTKIDLNNNEPLYLNYYSDFPVNLKLKISKNTNSPLIVKILRPILDSDKDSIQLKEFLLEDQINFIDLNSINDSRYILIKNLVSNFRGKTDVEISIVANTLLPQEKINFTLENHDFHLDRYSSSYFGTLDIDSTCVFDLSILKNKLNKDLDFNFIFYDSNKKINLPVNVYYDKSKTFFSFYLEKGRYNLKIYNTQNSSPTEVLPKKIANASSIFVINNVYFLPEPPNSIMLFKNWLNETGLDQYFKVLLYKTDILLKNDFLPKGIEKKFIAKRYSLAVRRSLIQLTDSIEQKKNYDLLEFDFNEKNDYRKFIKKSWYNKYYEPKFFLYLLPIVDKTDMNRIENAYQDEFGVSIWKKIFDKIRLFNNSSFENIVVYVPVNCGADWVYADANGKNIGRYGTECESGGYSKLLPDFSRINTNSKTKLNQSIDIGRECSNFLKNETFKNSSVTFEYLDIDEFSLNVIVRNIKGYIFRGDDKWEKIEIKCFIREGKNGKYFHVETDGVFTGGLGNYPKDSQFDKSFEPKYTQNLVNFSKSFATSFISYLKNKK